MLINLMGKRSARVMVQGGALVAAAVAILGPLLVDGAVGQVMGMAAVTSLLLVVVKGLLVVAVAVNAANHVTADPPDAEQQVGKRELQQVRRLLDKFFDDDADTSIAGKVERLERLVEPAAAVHSSQGQELLALRERVERLERLGP